MSSRTKKAAIVLAAIFAVAQLIRPERTNPPIDVSRTIQAQIGTASGLAAVVGRACGDCHSNNTVWPWYTRIAPVSWAMAYGVKEGRKAVNFSEWAAYPPEVQRTLLVASCQDAKNGKMPGSYTLLHPEMRLSDEDVQAICAAARPSAAVADSSRSMDVDGAQNGVIPRMTAGDDGGAMDYLEVSAHMKVRPGCLDGFKKQAAELIRITKEKDTRTLRYDWFLSTHGTECEVREAYTGSEGLIEHNTHILEARTRLFREYADGHFMTFYGEPSQMLLDLLKSHQVGHTWFHFLQGLEGSPVQSLRTAATGRDVKQPV